MHSPACHGGGRHFSRFICVDTERLFTQYVLAAPYCSQRVRPMIRVTSDDRDRIYVGSLAQFVEVGMNTGNAEFVGEPTSTVFATTNRNNLGAGVRLQSGDVAFLSECAGSYHCTAQFG